MENTVFISDAYAQAAGAGQQPDPIINLLFIGGLFVLMYFMMIRPQMKRQKEQKKMIEALQVGDEVVTVGGIVGRVEAVEDVYVSLCIGHGVTVRLQKSAVVNMLLRQD